MFQTASNSLHIRVEATSAVLLLGFEIAPFVHDGRSQSF